MRIVLCDILSKVLNKKIENNYKRIAIYGSGERSVQLLNILKNQFIDLNAPEILYIKDEIRGIENEKNFNRS